MLAATVLNPLKIGIMHHHTKNISSRLQMCRTRGKKLQKKTQTKKIFNFSHIAATLRMIMLLRCRSYCCTRLLVSVVQWLSGILLKTPSVLRISTMQAACCRLPCLTYAMYVLSSPPLYLPF